MRKLTQKVSNPFPFSDSNKRYYTYEYYLRRTFGKKCAKLPLDAGFSCPNIDGLCGVGGCIYCSGRGSGDFAESPSLSVAEQIKKQREKLGHKWDTSFCIPYFQAHTNTYAPLHILRKKFEEALEQPGVVGLNIATRADCLPDDTVDYLAELAKRTVLTVELGLQTIHDSTAKLINRGHTYRDFLDGFKKLRSISENINICVHLILGLPGESFGMIEETANEVAKLHPEQVKIHLLHVLKGTELENMYHNGTYIPLERECYIDIVIRVLELLPPDIVIARLTGDGNPDNLIAPLWSVKKATIVTDIDKKLFQTGSMQGKAYMK